MREKAPVGREDMLMRCQWDLWIRRLRSVYSWWARVVRGGGQEGGRKEKLMELCFSGLVTSKSYRLGEVGSRAGSQRGLRRNLRMSVAKVVLVTGSTDGIGLHTAKNLVKAGYRTLIHGRNPEKVSKAAAMLRKQGPGQVEEYVADLSEMKNVRTLASKIRSKHDKLDILINNAGVFEQRRIVSPDGFEMTFQVNVLAPFLLTSLLLDLLLAAPSGRILHVGSIAHMHGGAGRSGGVIDFSNLQHEKGYDVYGAYGLSKLCLITLTYQMASRLKKTSVTVNTCDPGTVNTKMLQSGWGNIGQDVSQADHETFVATSQTLEGVTGKYFVGGHARKSAATTYDRDIQAKLWQELEAMTGAEYPPSTY